MFIKKNLSYLIIFCLLSLLPILSHAQDYSSVGSSFQFARDLGQGNRGQDVENLQCILELSTPTGYFGPITAAALTAFQNAYASDILTPVGLTSGTGYFGSSTRNYINHQLLNASSSNPTCPTYDPSQSVTPPGPITYPPPNPNPQPNPNTTTNPTPNQNQTVACPVGYTCLPTQPNFNSYGSSGSPFNNNLYNDAGYNSPYSPPVINSNATANYNNAVTSLNSNGSQNLTANQYAILKEALALANPNGQTLCSANAPTGQSLACAWSVNIIVEKALGKPIDNSVSTIDMQHDLANDPRFQLVSINDLSKGEPGDIIISPAQGPNNLGHVGICVKEGCAIIVSNSSAMGVLSANQTASSWASYYMSVTKHLTTYIYKPL